MSDEFNHAELHRRLANLIRIGVIEEADYTKAKARVRIGDLLTAWLSWTAPRAGGDIEWQAPEVGEQVLVLAPSGELSQAIICPAIYSAQHPAPADRKTIRKVTFADGTIVEYDREAHRFTMAVAGENADVRVLSAGKVTVTADGDATISAAGIALIEGGNATLLGSESANDPIARKSDLQEIKNWADSHTHPSVPAPTSSCPLPACSANVQSI